MYSIEGVDINRIDNIDVVTVAGFAKLVHRAVPTVRKLIATGNRLCKIRTIYIGDKPFIPLSELFSFPFTLQGRSDDLVFNYRLVDGKLKIVKAEGYCSMKHIPLCDKDCKNCLQYRKLDTTPYIDEEEDNDDRVHVEDDSL